MQAYQVDQKLFNFKYLPQYATFLLKEKLEEFVTVGIRFCREADLPMLKPLSKLSEEELVAISLDSNRLILKALENGTIADFINGNIQNWIGNKLGIIDKSEIVTEDLVLVHFLRRKLFAHFLYSYTQNAAVQQLIISEVDVYTTQEELLGLKVYLEILKGLN
jgi:hypothetical protein